MHFWYIFSYLFIWTQTINAVICVLLNEHAIYLKFKCIDYYLTVEKEKKILRFQMLFPWHINMLYLSAHLGSTGYRVQRCFAPYDTCSKLLLSYLLIVIVLTNMFTQTVYSTFDRDYWYNSNCYCVSLLKVLNIKYKIKYIHPIKIIICC